jgi:hypothetical protein
MVDRVDRDEVEVDARLDVVWRRLPFTSTSVWLGDNPRIFACSVWLAMSPPNACAVNDGTTLASALMRSGLPALSSSVASSTWIGDALANSSTPEARVPVTMTVSVTASAIDASASASCACSSGGAPAIAMAIEVRSSQVLLDMNFSPW